jgi:hypothetical protein
MHWPPDPQMRNPAAASGRVYRSIWKAWASLEDRYYTFASFEATIVAASVSSA